MRALRSVHEERCTVIHGVPARRPKKAARASGLNTHQSQNEDLVERDGQQEAHRRQHRHQQDRLTYVFLRMSCVNNVTMCLLGLTALQQLREGNQRFAALILEPLVMGAGGMIFVDPLFQRVMVDILRDSSSSDGCLSVIFDEVFVGLRRA